VGCASVPECTLTVERGRIARRGSGHLDQRPL
jgi:hypothetical protein